MRRKIFAFCVFLAAALPCPAQGDKPKPNTLTPKEIADGWILLFDGETTFGWRFEDGTTIADGAIVMQGKKGTRFVAAQHLTNWGNSYEVLFEYRLDSPEEMGAVIQLQGSSGSPLLTRKGNWCSTRVVFNLDPATRKLDMQNFPDPSSDNSYTYSGKWPKDHIPESFVGFIVNPKAKLEVRSIKLRPFNNIAIELFSKPKTTAPTFLFNSKDLAGWKEFPGKKSRFTVTDAGEINVKDGPGDLQTTGKFKDFILQLECKSNGKHLNSGVFFRCRDGEYQNGYEAQIRNEFTEKPTQKYQIEEFDPMTNKLIGKKEILSAAVDYGTGAIYRRMPARKEMAKDGEWFGMTIVAHGNHFATWVNGVQVVDWTDNRPKSDNARTGCKLDAGHISIQGHDPTTDLSFRNIRIAEFK
jgi:hypothetical protein